MKLLTKLLKDLEARINQSTNLGSLLERQEIHQSLMLAAIFGVLSILATTTFLSVLSGVASAIWSIITVLNLYDHIFNPTKISFNVEECITLESDMAKEMAKTFANEVVDYYAKRGQMYIYIDYLKEHGYVVYKRKNKEE